MGAMMTTAIQMRVHAYAHGVCALYLYTFRRTMNYFSNSLLLFKTVVIITSETSLSSSNTILQMLTDS